MGKDSAQRSVVDDWARRRRLVFLRATLVAWFASSVALIFLAIAPMPSGAESSQPERVVLGRLTNVPRETLACHDLGPIVSSSERDGLVALIRSAGFDFEERRATNLEGYDFIVQIALPESIDLALLKREEWAAREVTGFIGKDGEANVLVIGAFIDESRASAVLDTLGEDVENVSIRTEARQLVGVSSIRVWNATLSRLRGFTELPVAPCPPVAAPMWFL